MITKLIFSISVANLHLSACRYPTTIQIPAATPILAITLSISLPIPCCYSVKGWWMINASKSRNVESINGIIIALCMSLQISRQMVHKSSISPKKKARVCECRTKTQANLIRRKWLLSSDVSIYRILWLTVSA